MWVEVVTGARQHDKNPENLKKICYSQSLTLLEQSPAPTFTPWSALVERGWVEGGSHVIDEVTGRYWDKKLNTTPCGIVFNKSGILEPRVVKSQIKKDKFQMPAGICVGWHLFNQCAYEKRNIICPMIHEYKADESTIKRSWADAVLAQSKS